MQGKDLACALKAILKTGDTVSLGPSADGSSSYRVIGSTGSVVKLMDAQGSLRLLSFNQLAQFAAEKRLLLNGIEYTPRG